MNETLLDMNDVKKKVNKALNSKRGFKLWFGLLLQYSLVDTVTANYHDFGSIASAMLNMAALMLETEIEEKDKKEILSTMKNLPPHDDVKGRLQQLKDAGFRLATLTNSAMPTLIAQLEYAGLSSYFEATLSVDAVKKYKPAPETYQYAAKTLGIAANEALLVAAHGWDIAGALQSGIQAAFIERKGQSLYPLAAKPQFIGKDLAEIAHAIIKQQ